MFALAGEQQLLEVAEQDVKLEELLWYCTKAGGAVAAPEEGVGRKGVAGCTSKQAGLMVVNLVDVGELGSYWVVVFQQVHHQMTLVTVEVVAECGEEERGVVR